MSFVYLCTYIQINFFIIYLFIYFFLNSIQLRRCYLELCRRILRNTNYTEHQHRKQDFMKIFTRIFCEETECSASDQQLVREIANEFPQLFKA